MRGWQHHAVLAKGDSKEKEKAMKLNKEDLEIMLKQGAYEHFIVRPRPMPVHATP